MYSKYWLNHWMFMPHLRALTEIQYKALLYNYF